MTKDSFSILKMLTSVGEDVETKKGTSKVQANEDRPKTPVHKGHFLSLKILKKEHLLGMAFVLAASTLVEGSVGNWGILFARTTLKMNVVVASIGVIVGQVLASLLRFSGPTLLKSLSARRFTIIGSSGAAIGILLEISGINTLISIFGLGIATLSISLCWPLIIADSNRATVHPELSLSAITAGGYVGLLLGPALVGEVSSASTLRAGLLVVVASGIATALLRSVVHPKYKTES